MIDGLDDLEQERAESFEHRHYYWCRKAYSCDSIGRHKGFTYHLHQTGIGLNVKVECCECGEVEDVTDYDSW